MTWLIVPFFLTIIAGLPIAFTILSGTVIYLLLNTRIPMEVLSQQMYQASASFPLMAIPFFLLAGDLMDITGITSRLVKFITIIVGRMYGGLAQVMVVAEVILSGLSGSGASDTAALSKILVPSMKKEGYTVEFGAALAAASGVLGPLIPPSICMIVYGSMLNVSVGALFIAGLVPGVIIAGALMVTIYVISRRENIPRREEPFTWAELFNGLKDASLALIMPVIILYGIRAGVFTPTEGGAVAALYALFLGIVVYRTLTMKAFFQALVGSGVTAAVIMLIVAAANPFGWLLALNKAPQMTAQFILDLSQSKYSVLFVINVVLLLAGMLMETNVIVIILGPILAPVATKLGVDPIHFAMIMITNLSIGLSTPPVGVNLFVAASVTGITLEQISRSVCPFLLVEICTLALITYIPELSLYLPRALGM